MFQQYPGFTLRRPERSRHHTGRTRFFFRGGAGGTAGGTAGTWRSPHSLHPLHSLLGQPATQFILHHWAHCSCVCSCAFWVTLAVEVVEGDLVLAADARDQSASHLRQRRACTTSTLAHLHPPAAIPVLRRACCPRAAHRARRAAQRRRWNVPPPRGADPCCNGAHSVAMRDVKTKLGCSSTSNP